MSVQSTTRLNKYISESGICSRREADRFIEQGSVFINGRRAGVGDRVAPGDRVKVNGRSIAPREAEDLVFIALNKPVGIVSTTESSERDNIVSFVRHSKRIFPIGRLDKDSQGLIFLTNNGDLVNKILRAGNEHEKEYLVSVDKPITDAFIQGMAGGVPILGTRTKKCKVSKESSHVFRITLVQGLNRQIRRMAEYFGYEVQQLERVRIMDISLKGLPVGEWRDLTSKELENLLDKIKDSSSEAAPGHRSQRRKPAGKSGGRSSSPGGGATGGIEARAGKRGSRSGADRSGQASQGGRKGATGKPAKPGKPAARSGAKPGAKSGAKPGNRPGARAGAKPAAKSGSRPAKGAGRSGARGKPSRSGR